MPCKSKERRKEQEQRKRVEKEGLDFLVWCIQEDKINEKTFGAATEDKESGLERKTEGSFLTLSLREKRVKLEVRILILHGPVEMERLLGCLS